MYITLYKSFNLKEKWGQKRSPSKVDSRNKNMRLINPKIRLKSTLEKFTSQTPIIFASFLGGVSYIKYYSEPKMAEL